MGFNQKKSNLVWTYRLCGAAKTFDVPAMKDKDANTVG